MRLDDFNFDLPEDRIALRPASPRDAARLLAVRPGANPEFEDRRVSDLPALLRPGDVLVFNDTRVIPAQIEGRRIGRGAAAPKIGLTLHKRLDDQRWRAFARPARKLMPGDHIAVGPQGSKTVLAVEEKHAEGEVTLALLQGGETLDAVIEAFGLAPLPPYIASRRGADSRDREDYQTVYARHKGAVAAPTAGLHFTPELLKRLRAAGVEFIFVTLHVGAGTFLPVKAARIQDHTMHPEWGELPQEAAIRINWARAGGGRIIAAGTTSLRVLESAALENGAVQAFTGETDIFITPGYKFRAVDGLLTNFHLPRSTLFMLVAAFCGLDVMQRAYAHAIASGYRFYSYGDACLLQPAGGARARAPSV